MDDFVTPILPKGRGLWRLEGNSGNVGRPNVASNISETKSVESQGFTDFGGFRTDNVQTSTPGSDVHAIHQLTDMMGQLGAQIGESIVAKLMSVGVVNLSGDAQNTPHNASHQRNESKSDSPQVTVHVTPDRDLQTFKGDGSDKVSVQDWIDMTKTYLKKRGTPLQDQAEEILAHLLGKARDIVKIALRGDPDLANEGKPALIYDVLLRYFSEASSCLPLADFYATLPIHKENPVDYWIRLNKAADRAQESMQRQGNVTSNLNNEVALMFVKHCPDPDLSSTFKWKPIHEWTSKEVQLRIDAHQREVRASNRTSSTTQLKVHTTTVAQGESTPQLMKAQVLEQTHKAVSHSSPPAVNLQASNSSSSGPPPLHNQVESHRSSCTPSMVAQNLQQSEERLLNRMVGMFEEAMERVQLRSSRAAEYKGSSRYRQRHHKEQSCKVCGNKGHSTVSHCLSDRLCFECFAPGHTKPQCPLVAPKSSPSQSQGN